MENEILAISPIDWRYATKTKELKEIFSEFGLIKKRVFVEIEWLKFLAKELQFFKIKKNEEEELNFIIKNFNVKDAIKIKNIEKTTNHDVKAVEYFIKEKLNEKNLNHIKEWVHFAATSDDINNTSYALMIKEGRSLILENLKSMLKDIENIGKKYKAIPMMSRTHGQPASPTTMGKEFINFADKIKEEIAELENIKIKAKFNGETGNFNAHYFAFENINWILESQNFIKKNLFLDPVVLTTQINPSNYIAKIMHC